MKFDKFALPAGFVVAFLLSVTSVVPSQAQLLKKLEKELLQGNQNGYLATGGQLAGNVSLPAGQYMMTNVQTGQAFYVTVNPQGQMLLSAPTNGQQQMMMPGMQGMTPQGMAPGMMQQQQSGGLGGMMRSGVGNFLRNELAPSSQQMPQQIPQQ